MSVVQLTNKTGLSPQMNKSCDEFAETVEAAVDKAADDNIPLELVLGSMVCTMLSMFLRAEDEE